MRTREDVLREYMTPIPLCYVALGDGRLVPKDNIDVNAMADRIATLEARTADAAQGEQDAPFDFDDYEASDAVTGAGDR